METKNPTVVIFQNCLTEKKRLPTVRNLNFVMYDYFDKKHRPATIPCLTCLHSCFVLLFCSDMGRNDAYYCKDVILYVCHLLITRKATSGLITWKSCIKKKKKKKCRELLFMVFDFPVNYQNWQRCHKKKRLAIVRFRT